MNGHSAVNKRICNVNKVKRKELYGKLLMIAILFMVVPWIMVVWTAMTGLTWAGRYSPGRIANEEDRTHSRHVAVLATVIAAPVAFWAAMKRRE
jgi:heme/copper-type cytochrome/quinol oxidase subunit 2